jgi:hypothetical protein
LTNKRAQPVILAIQKSFDHKNLEFVDYLSDSAQSVTFCFKDQSTFTLLLQLRLYFANNQQTDGL